MGHGNGTCQSWSTSLSNVCIRESMRHKLGLHMSPQAPSTSCDALKTTVPREPDASDSSRFPEGSLPLESAWPSGFSPNGQFASKPSSQKLALCVAHASLASTKIMPLYSTLQQHQMKWVDLTCNFLQHLHVFFGRLGSYPFGAINLPWANTTKPADSSWLHQQCSNEA